MSRLLVATLAIAAVSLLPDVASAQEARPDDAVVQRLDVELDLAPAHVTVVGPAGSLDAAQLPLLARPSPVERQSNRSSALLFSLYASTAAVQALDVHSTMTALNQGAVESNPLMEGVVRNKTAFIAMKAGVAAATILATRHMARRNRIAAIATVVAINSAYAMVMRHNYRVARRQR